MRNSIPFWHNVVFVDKIDQSHLDAANLSFSDGFKKLLQEKSLHYTHSLVARYLIAHYLWGKTGNRYELPLDTYSVSFSPEKQSVKNIFFSYSFTTSIAWDVYVAWIVAECKVGIDVEFVKERTVSLLQKYGVPDRDAFYTLRTAKEAIVKYNNFSANDIERIDIETYPFVGKKVLIDGQEIVVSLMF